MKKIILYSLQHLLLPILFLLMSFCTILSYNSTARAQDIVNNPVVLLPPNGFKAPNFELYDVKNKKRSLAQFHGQSIVIFFFCGCSWCSEVATEWATLQRSGVLSVTKRHDLKLLSPITLIVYSGVATEASKLAQSSGLTSNTIVLCDPDLKVTVDLYHAEPCPRAIILDSNQCIYYINRGLDDAPRVAPADMLVAKCLNALRATLSSIKPKH